MPRRRKYYTPIGCVLPIFLLALTLGAAITLPLAAQNTFGPARPGINPILRLQYSLILFLSRNALIEPLDPAGSERLFIIPFGSGAAEVAARLEQEGFIRNANAFQVYLLYSGLDTRLQAGEFQLSPALNATQIAGRLLDYSPTTVRFGVLPGWRLEEIAQSLPSSGLAISPEAFLLEARSPSNPPDFMPEGMGIEGLIIAKEYTLPRDLDAAGLVRHLLEDFSAELTPNLRNGFAAQSLDVYQAATLASIIEREAVIPEEQPLIASVFLNRLAAGMKLEADPTVQYPLGNNTAWWKSPLTYEDLQVPSPYNTYLYYGLPPGPIASPSLGALEAAANPSQTTYYFFRATCDGSRRHNFAETFDQHLQNACP
jgi:UPF0755 protein